jgi:predicted ATPase
VQFVRERLDDEQRLISVTGVPGVGKTRLCLEVARELYEDSDTFVWWLGDEAPEGSGSDPADRRVPVDLADLARRNPWDIRKLLPSKESVLILDGLDQGPDDLDWVPRLLAACPRLSLLVTSREPVRVLGEWVVPLEPLELPPAVGPGAGIAPGRAASERLLLERIKRVRPALHLGGGDLSALAEICQLVDGIPIALEQAAFACMAQSVQMVRRQLTQDPFALPTIPPHLGHTVNLRHVLQRSLGALGDSCRHLIGQLGTLDGDWSLPEAAAQLPEVPTDFAADIHTLMEHGLLRTSESLAAPRFRVLNLVRPLVTPVGISL